MVAKKIAKPPKPPQKRDLKQLIKKEVEKGSKPSPAPPKKVVKIHRAPEPRKNMKQFFPKAPEPKREIKAITPKAQEAFIPREEKPMESQDYVSDVFLNEPIEWEEKEQEERKEIIPAGEPAYDDRVYGYVHKSMDNDPNPPIFIKVNKYKEIARSISDLKSFSLSLRDALDALMDVEKELQRGLSLTQRALDKFNNAISTLDSRLLRVGGINENTTTQDERKFEKDVDGYLHNLYDQIEKIRGELKSIQ